MSVVSKEWQAGKMDTLEKDWDISYVFYEKSGSENIRVQGMNYLKTLSEKRETTIQLLAKETVQALPKEYFNNKVGQ